MPGIVIFRRRWSVGSDDFVVPALFLIILHLIWIVVLAIILGVVQFDRDILCMANLHDHVLGYLVILSVCVVTEVSVMVVSMRGTILDTKPRASMQYLLYIRLAILVVELSWLVVGVVWISQHYQSCVGLSARKAILGIIVCNWAVMLSVLISVWCTFDTAGRSWVKMMRYQEGMKEREARMGNKKCSGGRRRNWRTRKALRQYEQSWDRRCGILFCCVKEDHHQSSLREVAKLFTEFFRDLDVVPSDIVAGLVLLRKYQKLRRSFVVSQCTNDVYQFLTGVPITPHTQFLSLQSPEVLAYYKDVVYFMRYALAAYGWPMYMKMHTATGLCHIMPNLSCCSCCSKPDDTVVVEDNCCKCNLAALHRMIGVKEMELTYATYHVGIGETPFYIALDHSKRKIIISIRGTLSLQDVLTDLKADAEQLPVIPPREDWFAHRGMVQAAMYIRNKIESEALLGKAFSKDQERGTQQYDLVCVGHSLGAGTAAILTILLRHEYPNIVCYAYSPPGGLISAPCVEGTKSFITSVVVGKDVVPRIGLYQLEALRQDLINVIKHSTDPKWKLITEGIFCGSSHNKQKLDHSMYDLFENQRIEKENRYFPHPSDSDKALTSHAPLFLPGRIIQIVRNHPKEKRQFKRSEPVYQAIWADNKDFDEVLISPTMLNDHMPDYVLEALEKVLTNVSPAKPVRRLMESEGRLLHTNSCDPGSLDRSSDQSFCPQCQNQDILHLSGTPIDMSLNSEDLIVPSVKFNLGTEANSLSWDYSTLPINHARRHPLPESVSRAERTKSFPPPLQKLRPGLQLDDLGNPEWGSSGLSVFAPLASPETLSEASSLDTMSSKQCSDGYPRASRLDPIPASPLRPPAGIHHYITPTASPVDYADLVNERCQLNDDVSYDNIAADISPITPDVVPLAQSTPLKPDMVPGGMPNSQSGLTDIMDNTLFSEVNETQADDSQRTSSDDLGVRPLTTEPDQTNLTDIEDRVNGKMTELMNNDPYRLTYDSDDGIKDTSSQQDFALHSPDSTCNQYLYDDYGGHYSPAGRGYPHGAYTDDVTDTEELVSDADNKSNSDIDIQVAGLPAPSDTVEQESNHSGVYPAMQTIVPSMSLQNVPVTGKNTENIENNSQTSSRSSLVRPQFASSPEDVNVSNEAASPASSFPLELADPVTSVCKGPEASILNDYSISPKSISRSSSDASLAENDCVQQPLLNKRQSCASTNSHSSRRTITNGSDLEDRSSMNSYEQNVLLLSDETDQNPRLNGVNTAVTEQHTFGETYYV